MTVLMFRRRRFRFRPALTLTVLVALAILLSLGTWQLQRLEWKLALIEKVETRVASAPIDLGAALQRARAGEDMEYQPVTAKGVFRHDLEARVFGLYDGAPGVYVFTPFERSGDAAEALIYVNRGFAPQAASAPDARQDGQIREPVALVGLFRSPETPTGIARWVRSTDQSVDGLWSLRAPQAFAAAAGVAAPPFYIDSDGAENPAPWPKGGVTRLSFRNNHFQYALTWFGLAATLIGVWAAFSFERNEG